MLAVYLCRPALASGYILLSEIYDCPERSRCRCLLWKQMDSGWMETVCVETVENARVFSGI